MALKDQSKLHCIGYYEVQEVILGKGNFATVYLAVHRVIGSRVALKVINHEDIKEEYVSRNLGREARILSKLSHPNIIHLYETITCDRLYCLSLELIRGVNLSQYLKRQLANRVPEKVARSFFYQMLSAINHMHAQNILHRDLKPENILVEHERVIKIVDFGLSNVYAPYAQIRTHCGSVEYAAPELFKNGAVYGSGIDMWSLGVILYSMVVGKMPFPFSTEFITKCTVSVHRRELFIKRISQGLTKENWECMEFLSSECWDLLENLLQPNPSKRCPVAAAMKHVWFKKDIDLRNRLPQERRDLQRKFHPEIMEYLAEKLGVPQDHIRMHIATTELNPITAMYAIVRDTLIKEVLFPPRNIEHSLLYKFDRWRKFWASKRQKENCEINEHGDGLKQAPEAPEPAKSMANEVDYHPDAVNALSHPFHVEGVINPAPQRPRNRLGISGNATRTSIRDEFNIRGVNMRNCVRENCMRVSIVNTQTITRQTASHPVSHPLQAKEPLRKPFGISMVSMKVGSQRHPPRQPFRSYRTSRPGKYRTILPTIRADSSNLNISKKSEDSEIDFLRASNNQTPKYSDLTNSSTPIRHSDKTFTDLRKANLPLEGIEEITSQNSFESHQIMKVSGDGKQNNNVNGARVRETAKQNNSRIPQMKSKEGNSPSRIFRNRKIYLNHNEFSKTNLDVTAKHSDHQENSANITKAESGKDKGAKLSVSQRLQQQSENAQKLLNIEDTSNLKTNLVRTPSKIPTANFQYGPPSLPAQRTRNTKNCLQSANDVCRAKLTSSDTIKGHSNLEIKKSVKTSILAEKLQLKDK